MNEILNEIFLGSFVCAVISAAISYIGLLLGFGIWRAKQIMEKWDENSSG